MHLIRSRKASSQSWFKKCTLTLPQYVASVQYDAVSMMRHAYREMDIFLGSCSEIPTVFPRIISMGTIFQTDPSISKR
jgi:hypothetical protein